MKLLPGSLLVAIVLLARPSTACAVNDPATTDATTIVVTGSGLPGGRADPAYDVTLIDRDRILQSASGRLEDVLRDIAGLQSFRRSDSRSANATSQSITLRGLGGNASSRALLVLDGVPQTDPFGGWVSFPAYATDRLGRIKVTRGGGSSLFGPGALAGTVELDSAAPDQSGAVQGSIAYGSRISIDGRGSLGLRAGSAFITFSGAYARGDGFTPIVATDRGPVDRAAPYRQYSGAARAVAPIGATTEIQANIGFFGDRRDRGLPFTANSGKGTDGSIRLIGKGKVGWSILGYAQKRNFASQSASVTADRTVATLTNNQYDVPSTGYGARGEVVPLTGPLEIRLGADTRLVKGEAREFYQYVAGSPTRRRIAGGRALTAGAFVDATYVAGSVTANLSGRIDHWKISDGRLFEHQLTGATLTDTWFADRSGWQPTGRAALAYRLAGGLTGRVAAYRGWRLATLNELYRPFRAGADGTAANAALKPETLTGAEIGAEVRLASQVKASATLFTGRLSNAIANVTVAQGPGTFPGVGFISAAGSYRRRENLDQIRARGFELGLDGRFGAFTTHLSYSYVDARVSDGGLGGALDGLRPAQTPHHQGSATIAYIGPRDIHISLTGRIISKQYDDDLNSRTLASAATLDGAMEVPVTGHLSVGVRGENLFDKQVEATISSEGIVERASPRTLWVQLHIR